MRSILRTLSLVACALSITAAAYAQNVSVVGTVSDETKSVLPGVTMTATDLETGRQFSAVTDAKGEYRLLNVPAGSYKIQAELSGFTTVILARVELLVGQNATIPFTLKLAQVSETQTTFDQDGSAVRSVEKRADEMHGQRPGPRGVAGGWAEK